MKPKDISKKQIMVIDPDQKSNNPQTIEKFIRGARLLLVIPTRKGSRIKQFYNRNVNRLEKEIETLKEEIKNWPE